MTLKYFKKACRGGWSARFKCPIFGHLKVTRFNSQDHDLKIMFLAQSPYEVVINTTKKYNVSWNAIINYGQSIDRSRARTETISQF